MKCSIFVRELSSNFNWEHVLNNLRRKPGESRLDWKKLEPQLNRLKNKQYPIKPKTSEAMAEELKKPTTREMFGKTLDKQRDFYIDSVVRPSFSFHLFASLAVISFIREHIKLGERFYSMGGTFQVVPRGLSQLLIISIQFKSKVSKTLTIDTNHITMKFL